MFTPNVRAIIRRRNGLNVYGQPIYGPRQTIMIGVVRLEQMSNPTSVRTDSSASRANAMEETLLSRILVPATTRKVEQGDVVELQGFAMTVQSVWPRYAISGTLDHWQVDLTINQEVS